MSRFSQAISEGDGISVVPLLDGDVGELAALAATAGAEAVAVARPADVDAVRARTGLAVLLTRPALDLDDELERLDPPDADACVLVFEQWAGYERLESLYGLIVESGVTCVVDVRDDEELEEALELLDPEILLLSERDRDRDEEDLERTLDLLPDVPAGKLVISEAPVVSREQAVALERAGVDAILVRAGASGDAFAGAVRTLAGEEHPR
jgi:indole-3-glycerol phosphate synthase